MVNQSSLESVIVETNQDKEQVNAKRKPSLKESISISANKGTNTHNARPRNGT